MPYKDLERKKAWEQQHRTQRLARRRELRRQQESAEATQHGVSASVGVPIGHLLVPLLAGAGLAAYNPKLALGAGGVTLLSATYFRKGWQWWLVGSLTILIALFFLNWDRDPGAGKKQIIW